ncbi:hypothetical protein PENSPDRAFT_752648 [Peniophora sp. CONT]|nr:hypothetical protein PENSPDRAFT_752648 [Peniophora sp. CONT]
MPGAEDGMAAMRADLNERRDALFSMTTTVPPEILEIIFQLVDNPPQAYHSSWSPPAAVQISHVCRRWRAIALSSKALWNALDTRMPTEAWTTHLARSHFCSLNVRSIWEYVDAKRIADIIAIFPHIQSLIIDTDSSDDPFTDLHAAFLSDSPALHTLEIGGPSESWDPTFNEYLAHRTPALRELALHQVVFPWGFSLADIRVLRLSTYNYAHEGDDGPWLGHNFQDVLRTLHAAHSLEKLTIWGDCVFTPPSELPIPTVTSPVRMLFLEGPVSRVGPMLAALQASNTLQAWINTEEYGNHWQQTSHGPEMVDDMTTVSACASDVLRNHLLSRGEQGPPEFTAFHMITDRDLVVFRLGFEQSPLSSLLVKDMDIDKDESHVPYLNFRLKLQVAHHGDKVSIRAKTLKLARSIAVKQLQCVRQLVLSALCWTTQDVESFFQDAYLVESLTIYTVSDVFEREAATLVADPVCASTFAASEPSLFPAIRTLRIVGVTLSSSTMRREGDVTQ